MRALVLVLALSGVARADEIAILPPPVGIAVQPAKPPTPRDHLLGVMFGAANTQVRDLDRTLITIGATWGRELIHRLYALAEYEWCLTLGTDPAMESVTGRAHVARVGVRVDALRKSIADKGAVYAGFEGQGGVMYGGDTELGTYLVPTALVGARAGFEIWPHDPEQSPSSTFGFYMRFGAMMTHGDTGFVFAIGLDWANRH